MPRSGYTSITVPIRLKDRLKFASSELGFPSVPQMLDSWLWERTGTVQVQSACVRQLCPNDPGTGQYFEPIRGNGLYRKKSNLVRPPGFEPGSSAWQADDPAYGPYRGRPPLPPLAAPPYDTVCT
jgi:hypothetical protein